MIIRIGELTRELNASTNTLLSTARNNDITLIDISRSKHGGKRIYAISYDDVPRLRDTIVAMRKQREEGRLRNLEKQAAVQARKALPKEERPKRTCSPRIKNSEVVGKLDLILATLELIVSELGIKRNNSNDGGKPLSRDAH